MHEGLPDENLHCLAINLDWENKAKFVEEQELKASTRWTKNLSDLTTRFPKRKNSVFTIIKLVGGSWRSAYHGLQSQTGYARFCQDSHGALQLQARELVALRG